MSIIINPGSGPVSDATHDDARANLDAFLADLSDGATYVGEAESYGEGRWGFLIEANGRRIEIQMPGLPLNRVRWLSAKSGSIWDFPRLYVDGDSWIWAFALNACGPEDDE